MTTEPTCATCGSSDAADDEYGWTFFNRDGVDIAAYCGWTCIRLAYADHDSPLFAMQAS